MSPSKKFKDISEWMYFPSSPFSLQRLVNVVPIDDYFPGQRGSRAMGSLLFIPIAGREGDGLGKR